MEEIEILEKWLKEMEGEFSKFTVIPVQEWHRLIPKLKGLALKRNDYFIKCGEIPDKLAYVVQGLFRVFHVTASGNDMTHVFREENTLISAYNLYLKNEESKFYFQAMEDSIVLYITLEDYLELLRKHSCWQMIAANYSQMLFAQKEKRQIEIISEDAQTRYNNFIKDYPQLSNRISQYYIASYLGITPETLSRIRRSKR